MNSCWMIRLILVMIARSPLCMFDTHCLAESNAWWSCANDQWWSWSDLKDHANVAFCLTLLCSRMSSKDVNNRTWMTFPLEGPSSSVWQHPDHCQDPPPVLLLVDKSIAYRKARWLIKLISHHYGKHGDPQYFQRLFEALLFPEAYGPNSMTLDLQLKQNCALDWDQPKCHEFCIIFTDLVYQLKFYVCLCALSTLYYYILLLILYLYY